MSNTTIDENSAKHVSSLNQNRDSVVEMYKDQHFAGYYAYKHERTPLRQLSNWRERQIMAKALRLLAPFDSVLDLPSGAGRFLPVLARFEAETFVSDLSIEMLQAGRRFDPGLAKPPGRFVSSAFQIPLADSSVDVVFCARLYHHFADRQERVAILRELARVARKGVVISFFLSETFKHRRRLKSQKRKGRISKRSAISREEMSAEAAEAGFLAGETFSLLPGYAELTATTLCLK